MSHCRMVFAGLALIASCNPFAASFDDSAVDVTVNVAGDLSLGPSTYGVALDGTRVATLPPGSTARIPLTGGSHLITFSGPEPESQLINGVPVSQSPTWCTALGPKIFPVEATGAVVKVSYDVSCPVLSGTGTLQITTSVTHTSAVPELRLGIQRTIGSGYSEQRIITPGKIDLTVPSGIYSFTLTGTNCTKTIDDLVFGYRQALVRDGGVGTTTLYLTCP